MSGRQTSWNPRNATIFRICESYYHPDGLFDHPYNHNAYPGIHVHDSGPNKTRQDPFNEFERIKMVLTKIVVETRFIVELETHFE